MGWDGMEWENHRKREGEVFGMGNEKWKWEMWGLYVERIGDKTDF